jgi:glutamate racemase
MKIGLIAGTQIDTKMGEDVFIKKGFDVIPVPISNTPEEQSSLQILEPQKLESIVSESIVRLKKAQVESIVIYCNSLSSAVNFERLKVLHDINIVTPHDVYKKMAKVYKVLGVLAANNQSAAGIEKTLQKSNPSCNVIGIGMLPLVITIEQGMPPEEIAQKFAFGSILSFFKALDCDALILGCTHFPYLSEQISAMTQMRVIDPASGIEELLLNN